MKKVYAITLLYLLLYNHQFIWGQATYIRPCFGVSAGTDIQQCSETCVPVARTAIPQYDNRETNTYVVQQMTMPSPAYNVTGTNVIVNQDDVWSGLVNIGFNFCFFGNTYNRLVIGANGLVSFNTAYAGAYCPWSFTGGIPDAGKPINSIMGAYCDVDPSVGYSPNRINYYTEGTAPCRRFVINFYRIPMFSGSCNSMLFTTQIVLHEGYNIVDVIVTNKPYCSSWNGGRSIIGIQNAAGNLAFAAPGQNPATSAFSNRVYRFYPNGNLLQTINWTEGGTIVSNTADLSVPVCPTSTRTFVSNLTMSKCDGSTFTVRDTMIVNINAKPAANAGPDRSLSCITPNITLGSPAVAGNTYSWSPAGGLSNPNIAQPTTSTPNTYYLTVTNNTTLCVNRDTVTISPLRYPVANAGTDATITCANPNVTIGTPAVAGHTYSWSPTTGLDDPNKAQPSASLANTYTLTIRNDTTGCTHTDAVLVSIDTLRPTANAGTDQLLTCSNTSFILGTAPVAGNSYSWSPAAGLSDPSIAQPSATLPNTYTLTVTKASNGCTATDAVSVTQNIAQPTANAGPDRTLTCSNTSFIIGNTSGAGNSYSWSPASGLNDASIPQPTVTQSNQYVLTVTNNTNNCTNRDTVVISRDTTSPSVDAGPDRLLTCSNPNFVIGTPAVAGQTYSWSPASGLSNAGIAQPTASTTGTFTLTATNTSNGCTKSDSVIVSVDTTRPAANAGTNQTITCSNTSFVIGSPAVAGNTYSWSPAAGLDNAAIAQPAASAAGTYTLTVTKTANGCTAADAVVIAVDTSRPAVNAGTDKTITCASPTHLIGSPAIAGNTYSWSPAAGLNNAAIAQPTASSTGTYTLSVTKTANGCTATDQVTVAVDTSRPVANAGTDRTITCANPTFVIGSPAIAGNTYSWSPAAGLSNPAIAQPTASTTGTYTVTVTKTANGCTASDAVVIAVDTSRPAANAGADRTLTCTNPSFVIGSPAIAGNTYSWSPAAGLSNAALADPTVSTTGTYTLTVTKTANGCTASDAVVIAVDTSKPVANAGADKIITCTSPTHIIGSPAVAGNTYSWSPAAGLNNAAIAQPTASSTGTYTLTVTKTANGCTASDAVTVAVDTSRPVANAGADKIITCASPTHLIGTAAAAGNTYSWSPAAGLDDAAIARPTVSTTGTYTLTVTKTANGCTNTDAVTVTVDTSRTLADAGPDRTITCSNPTHTIGTASIPGNTYNWSPAIGLSNASIAQPTTSTTGTYTVTVTKTINGCTTTDAVIIAVDTTRPVANAGADKIITCTTPIHTIGTAAQAGNTYSWSPSAGLNNDAIAQPVASTTGNYILTVTKTANGCTSTDDVTIAVDTTRPVANAGANKVITCVNPTHVIGTTGISGNSYSWSPAAGLDDAAIARPTVSTTGTYTLTVTKIINGCKSTDDVVVNVDTTRTIADAGSDKVITCANPTHTIGTAGVAGNTYSWTPSAGLNNAGIAQPVASTTGTYTVTVTKNINGCVTSDEVIISVDTTKPAVNAGIDRTLTCAQTSFIIGTAAQPGNTYSWSPSAGLSDAGIDRPTVTTTGTYTLTVTKSVNGCTSSDVMQVAVDTTKPTVNAGPDKLITCSNPTHIIGTPSIAGNTYSWSPAAGLDNRNLAEPTVSTTGTYTLTVTKTANGCKSTDVVEVAVDTSRPSAIAGADKIITCANPTPTIGTAAVAGNTYSWSPVSGLNNPVIAQPTVSSPDLYTVTVTKISNGCNSTDAVSISQNITTTSAIAGADQVLTCTNPSFIIGAPATPGNTYSWTPAAGLDDAAIAQPTVSAPGTYTLTVTNAASGCTTDDVITIEQNITPPLADAGTDKSFTCIVKNIQIGTTVIAGNTYSWLPSTGLNNPNVPQPTATKTGTYTVTVTNTSNGCKATDSIQLTMDTIRPVADAGPDQTLVCLNINTTASTTLGAPSVSNYSYVWTPAELLSDPSAAQPATNNTGIYILTVTDVINGCKSKDTAVVDTEECICDFYIPSAFSPNNDGVNDQFYPFFNCDNFTGYSMSIFNRWGELVFKTSDISTGWDGFFKSESQEVDSYVWVIEYFDELRNKTIMKKGVLTLLK
jgi:gliding motility-associated-like protein